MDSSKRELLIFTKWEMQQARQRCDRASPALQGTLIYSLRSMFRACDRFRCRYDAFQGSDGIGNVD